MTLEVIISFLVGVILVAGLCFYVIRFLMQKQAESFELVAQKILEESSLKLKSTASEHFGLAVDPLALQIKEYRDYFERIQNINLKDREGLKHKLDDMLSSAAKIGAEASSLTQALTTDVKFQGAWGEMTLVNILEMSGLEKNREYLTQDVKRDTAGQVFRPDVVVKLPGNSEIIIDSKVSLKAYFDFVNTDNKVESLKNLKTSVLAHIDGLAKKNYQNLEGVTGPEFVYLFIPVEGVFSLILKEFPDLFDTGIKKSIILVSPVSLIANLKTIASVWRLEKQSENAEDMARKAGAMYDKFASLLDDFEKLAISLERSKSIHQSIVTKLSGGRGNLMNRAAELKELGAKTNKEMPTQLKSVGE